MKTEFKKALNNFLDKNDISCVISDFIKSIKYKESEHAFSEAGTFSEHLENAKDGITGGAKDPIDDPFDDPFADF